MEERLNCAVDTGDNSSEPDSGTRLRSSKPESFAVQLGRLTCEAYALARIQKTHE
jgi:hypothetical protein